MRIQMFWDQEAPAGIELPMSRLIERIFEIPVDLDTNPIMINGYNRGRNQYNASQILERLQNAYIWRFDIQDPVLLVIPHDLYVPGSDFVFGLARPSCRAAVVSTARLHNTFYGREESADDAIERAAKEGAHEIGHLFGLGHCTDRECIMFRPETLDELDRKKKKFCDACRSALADALGRNDPQIATEKTAADQDIA